MCKYCIILHLYTPHLWLCFALLRIKQCFLTVTCICMCGCLFIFCLFVYVCTSASTPLSFTPIHTFPFPFVFIAQCRLQGIMHPSFICWFRHYIYIYIYIYIYCFACLHHLLPHLSFFLHFFSYLLPYLSFPLRIDPLHFQAGFRKRQVNLALVFLWSPYGIEQTIIFSSCRLFYLSSSFFSSPNLSRCRLDVCHTSTNGVALVRI